MLCTGLTIERERKVKRQSKRENKLKGEDVATLNCRSFWSLLCLAVESIEKNSQKSINSTDSVRENGILEAFERCFGKFDSTDILEEGDGSNGGDIADVSGGG